MRLVGFVTALLATAVALGCGGSQASVVACGEGTERRGNTCVPSETSTTATTSTSMTLEDSPEADVDAAALADFAARVCECQTPACALDISRALGDWNRGRQVSPSPGLQQSMRVYLTCVAKISAGALQPKPTAKAPAKAAKAPPTSVATVTIEAFSTEIRDVAKLLTELEARDADRAAEPKRLFAAVMTNTPLAMKDPLVRERLMRMLAKVRVATEKRLKSVR